MNTWHFVVKRENKIWKQKKILSVTGPKFYQHLTEQKIKYESNQLKQGSS